MSAAQLSFSQRAAQAAAHGMPTLAPGQALTLRPTRAGVLRARHGALWITRRGPHPASAGAAGGDVFLRPSESLALRAGEVLVLEPVAVPGLPLQRVALDWQARADVRWRDGVAHPASALQRALREAVTAGGQLVRGTLAWAWHRVVPCRDAGCVHDA